MKKNSLTLLPGILLNTGLKAQTTLVAGDIAFTGYIINTTSANVLPAGNTSVTQTAGTGNSSFFFASACRIISRVEPNGVGPVSGNVTTEVWVEGSVPAVGGIPFEQRHYQITPMSGTTGWVTLYFTQTDFNNFNAARAVYWIYPVRLHTAILPV